MLRQTIVGAFVSSLRTDPRSITKNNNEETIGFLHYQTDFLRKRASLGLEIGNHKTWLSLDPPRQPSRPRWSLDWLVLFQDDDMFFRVREEFEPYSFPRVAEAYRHAFSFHYGNNT